ncbi:MAG: hypothetical protein IJ647_02940 [Prevotella sp.]|nr:hypothetical protein [Prevotella sp.]
MKKVNEVFFGEHGLTSTSANHLANIAQEKIVSNEAKLKNLNFVTATVDIVGSPANSGKVINRGYDEAQLSEVHGLLSEIADMNAFCAWIREAIKAKESELNNATVKSFEEWMKENELENKRPDYEEVSADDIMAEMTVKERNEYFRLEAVAATIGKYIHKDGVYSVAREELHNRLMKPYSTEGTGKQTLIYSYTPSIDQQKVEDLFFELQKWHRSNEQKLNRIKYNIRRKVAKQNLEKSQKYRGEMEEYNICLRELNTKFREWKIKECERLSQLKIVIPLELQPVYDALCALEQ